MTYQSHGLTTDQLFPGGNIITRGTFRDRLDRHLAEGGTLGNYQW